MCKKKKTKNKNNNFFNRDKTLRYYALIPRLD